MRHYKLCSWLSNVYVCESSRCSYVLVVFRSGCVWRMSVAVIRVLTVFYREIIITICVHAFLCLRSKDVRCLMSVCEKNKNAYTHTATHKLRIAHKYMYHLSTMHSSQKGKMENNHNKKMRRERQREREKKLNEIYIIDLRYNNNQVKISKKRGKFYDNTQWWMINDTISYLLFTLGISFDVFSTAFLLCCCCCYCCCHKMNSTFFSGTYVLLSFGRYK